jgi:hypothetical protein
LNEAWAFCRSTVKAYHLPSGVGGDGMKIPARVEIRIAQQIKKLQSTISDARKRDVNESDTALIVADVLSDVLGYKKLEEITTEHAIRGAFADLAVHVGNDVRFLVEVKAINTELKESHVTQVVNYAANLPSDWVVLTNAARWQAYKVSFGKPIDRTLVLDVDLGAANSKSDEVIEFFGSLSREVFTSNSMSQIFHTKQAMSRYSVAAVLLSDAVVGMVRRELRKMADGLNPDIDEIRTIIQEQVIKRELTDGDEAKAAAKAVRRATKSSDSIKTSSTQDKVKSEPAVIRAIDAATKFVRSK